MSKRMVADLMAFIDDPFKQIRICLAILAHDKKRRFYIFCFKNVQNLRCPAGVRAVIKCQDNLPWLIASSLNEIRRWNFLVSFAELSLAVGTDRARAVLRNRLDLQYLTRAVKV